MSVVLRFSCDATSCEVAINVPTTAGLAPPQADGWHIHLCRDKGTYLHFCPAHIECPTCGRPLELNL